MWNYIFEIYSKKEKATKKYFLISSYFFSTIIVGIVYITGGTSRVYANLMYLPMAIVASTNGKKYGVIFAVINALLIGPFMPINVYLNISQKPINWITRLIIYSTIAFVIGFFSDYSKQQFEKITKKEKEISEAQMATIYALVKLSEFRDGDTAGHTERIAVFCKLLAGKLRNIAKYSYIDEDYIENIYKGSLLHDIGKVGIPDRILLKPGKLSMEEFEMMKTHTTIGANTLLEVKKKYIDNKFLKFGIYIAHFHHEKWNGTGYPNGLSGENIPLPARIIAIADVYDALRSKRVYKEAYSHEKSLEIIKQGDGTHFDPVIVKVFVENEVEFKNAFE